MMGNEQENLLKKYTTCSNTPEITVGQRVGVHEQRLFHRSSSPDCAEMGNGDWFTMAQGWRDQGLVSERNALS
jgi:hypothetical protein